ncbi:MULTISPECIES: hypothetical protein [Variovorax]|uniref:hypothetical protein n=1 Tax=Variovorax TaxID=34072 RepID=UPI0028581178|nr:hypothetical protein [Variovorax sp. 3319]MDR6886166.1 hypothetical protein [Variovorax sp. 3319]
MTEPSPKLAPHEWVNAFASEWNRLVEGHCDLEAVHEIGWTLSRVVGDQPPEAIVAKYFENHEEQEDPARDPEGAFTDLAADLGIIKPGDRLDDVQMEFAYGVVDLCAAIGDRYGDKAYGNAGDHIRSVYGPA